MIIFQGHVKGRRYLIGILSLWNPGTYCISSANVPNGYNFFKLKRLQDQSIKSKLSAKLINQVRKRSAACRINRAAIYPKGPLNFVPCKDHYQRTCNHFSCLKKNILRCQIQSPSKTLIDSELRREFRLFYEQQRADLY